MHLLRNHPLATGCLGKKWAFVIHEHETRWSVTDGRSTRSPAAATTTISCKDAEERFGMGMGMGPNTFH